MRYIDGYRCKGIVWFGMKRYARGERDPRASRVNGPMEAARKGLTPHGDRPARGSPSAHPRWWLTI